MRKCDIQRAKPLRRDCVSAIYQMREREKKTQGSINVVLRTVIVCKLQGEEAPAVVRQGAEAAGRAKC